MFSGEYVGNLLKAAAAAEENNTISSEEGLYSMAILSISFEINGKCLWHRIFDVYYYFIIINLTTL